MARRRAFGSVVAVVLAAPILAAVAAAPAGAATGCGGTLEPGQTRYTWVGGDGNWTDAANWSTTGAPVADNVPTYVGSDVATDDSTDGLVCISPASPATITLDSNAHVHVQALVVANATLVATGARVMVYAPASSAISTIHDTASVELRGSTLGGPGQIDVEGTVVWGRAGFGVGTFDNDHCADFGEFRPVDACAGLTHTGRMRVVAPEGFLRVDGRGVNLLDGYTVEVAGGQVAVLGQGYIAADRDARIEVGVDGTFAFDGDGNVLEGRANGQPVLAAFVNGGTVVKRSGSGRSVLNVTYSGGGAVDVDSGGLSIAAGGDVMASVDAGSRLGTGTCLGVDTTVPTQVCTPAATEHDPQFAVLSPIGDVDQVSLQEGQTTDVAKGDQQPVISVETDDATVDVPSTIDFEFHDSASPERVSATIFRRRPGLASERIPLCDSGARIPAGVSACVIGRRVTGSRVQVRVRAVRPSGAWTLRQSGIDFHPLASPIIGSRPGCMVTHRTYPNVAHPYVRLGVPGAFSVRFATLQNTKGSGVVVGSGAGGVGLVRTRVVLRRTGWVAAVGKGVDGQLESSGSFRAIATPTVQFGTRSRSATAGRGFLLRGDVDPGGRRVLALHAVRVPAGSRTAYLARTGIRVTTDTRGRFTIRYVPRRAGRYLFAVNVGGKGGLSTAMSRVVVKVLVKAPVRRAPAPTVTRPIATRERTATVTTGTQRDLLDQLAGFYPGRVATTCRFRATY